MKYAYILLLLTLLSQSSCKKPSNTTGIKTINFRATQGSNTCSWAPGSADKYNIVIEVFSWDGTDNTPYEYSAHTYTTDDLDGTGGLNVQFPQNGAFEVVVTMIAQNCSTCCTCSSCSGQGKPMFQYVSPAGSPQFLAFNPTYIACLPC
jgi:hypothetical protein